MLYFKNYIDEENVPECFPAVPAHAHVDRFPSSESGQEELRRLGCGRQGRNGHGVVHGTAIHGHTFLASFQ